MTDRKAWLEAIFENNLFEDLRNIFNVNANFVTALALSAYTEAIGGLINGNLTDRADTKKNYRTFLERMGYTPIESERYYYNVRCGLTHAIFIKGARTSVAKYGVNEAKGIVERDGGIFFLIANYMKEFQAAYDKYKGELLSGVGNLQAMFDAAMTGSTQPEQAMKVYDSALVASFPVTPFSGGALIFVPTMGPMPPGPVTES